MIYFIVIQERPSIVRFLSYLHFFVLYVNIVTSGNYVQLLQDGKEQDQLILINIFWTTEMKQIRSIKSSILNRIGDVSLCQDSLNVGIIKSFDFGVIFLLFSDIQNHKISIMWNKVNLASYQQFVYLCSLCKISTILLHNGYQMHGRTNTVSSLYIQQNGNSRCFLIIDLLLYFHYPKYIIIMASIGY